MKINFIKYFKLNWKYKPYQIWVINTRIDCHLYLWENWCLLLPLLNELVQLTEEPAFIRTYQAYDNKNAWLGFGRMKWSEEHNIRWTTKYRKNNPLENELEFHKTEIWAPDWNRVCKTDMPPDIFICLYNYSTVPEIKEGITIALPSATYKKNKIKIDEILTKLVASVKNSNLYEIKRDWWGRTATRNNIEDMGPQDIKEVIGS